MEDIHVGRGRAGPPRQSNERRLAGMGMGIWMGWDGGGRHDRTGLTVTMLKPALCSTRNQSRALLRGSSTSFDDGLVG
jgi:hypothetical protein